MLYSGGKRENLAGRVEKQLIEASLRLATYDAQKPSAALAVSLTDQDLETLARAPSPLVRDAALQVYADVLTRILEQKPALVVLSWLPSAHPDEKTEWDSIERVLKSAPDPRQIIIAYPIGEMAEVPPELKRDYLVMEAEDCVYEINSYCTYNPGWNRWLIQALVERLWPNPPKFHVSDNLPHVFANFLLHVPSKESVPRLSFQSVLSRENTAQLEGKLVFIGNDVSQDVRLKDNKAILRRTYTAESAAQHGNLLANGTPLHVFWAQLAEMLAEGQTLAVAPSYICTGVLVLTAAIILVTMYQFGQAASVALLLSGLLLAPLMNALLIRYGHAYLPLFPVCYGSLLVYLFSAFGTMSFHNFKKYRLEALRQSFALTADLKGNFISLISHNLNTPIAKLLGLVEVLLAQKRMAHVEPDLKECRRLVTEMQIFAKSALLSTTLEHVKTSAAKSSLKALLHEFEQGPKPLLKRLNIDIAYPPLSEDVQYAPLALDPRHGGHALACLLLAAAVPGQKLELTASLAETDGRGDFFPPRDAAIVKGDIYLLLSIKPLLQGLNPTLLHAESHDEETSDVRTSVLIQYVKVVVRAYGGRLRATLGPANGQSVTLALPLAS